MTSIIKYFFKRNGCKMIVRYSFMPRTELIADDYETL